MVPVTASLAWTRDGPVAGSSGHWAGWYVQPRGSWPEQVQSFADTRSARLEPALPSPSSQVTACGCSRGPWQPVESGAVHREPCHPLTSGLWCLTHNTAAEPCWRPRAPGAILGGHSPVGSFQEGTLSPVPPQLQATPGSLCKGLRSVMCTSLESLGLLCPPWALPVLFCPWPSPAAPADPSWTGWSWAPAFAANTGGGVPNCSVLLTPPRVGNQIFK